MNFSPDKLGVRPRPQAEGRGWGRAVRRLAPFVVALVVALVASVGIPSSSVAAQTPFDDGSAPGIVGFEQGAYLPTVSLGVATAATAVGVMGVAGTVQTAGAVCATGAGCVVLTTGAVAAAGFAVGYYGAGLVCNALMSGCEGYQMLDTEPSGFSATNRYSCIIGSQSGTCHKYSWASMVDYGVGAQRFGGVYVDRNGDRFVVGSPYAIRGCVVATLNPVVSMLSNSPTDTTCPGGPVDAYQNSSPIDTPPFGGGWVRSFQTCPVSTVAAPGANCGFRPGDKVRVHPFGPVGNGTYGSGKILDLTLLSAGMPAAPEVDARGDAVRLRTIAQCFTAPSTTVSVTTSTGWVWESTQPQFPAPGCTPGSIVTAYVLEVDWDNRGTTVTTIQREFSAPPDWSNPSYPHKECVKFQTTPCRLRAEPVPDEPETLRCMWGPSQVPNSYCNELPEVTPTGVKSLAPAEEPDPTPITTTTAVGSPTTVPVTTTTPTTIPPAGPGSPPAGPPTAPTPGPDGGGTGWSGCVADYTDGAFDDVSVNPITWVRAMVQWMVAPIICAVWWLLVPDGGFRALFLRFWDIYEDAAVLAPIRAFTDSFTFSGSACMPVNLPDAWGVDTPTIDLAMCGSPVVGMVWSVAVALGVLAIAKEVLRTMAALGSSRQSSNGVGSGSEVAPSAGGDTFDGPADIGATGSWEDYGTGGSFS